MKKILFIFVLSLYSIQGFTSSCPDGIEPVKSVSDDGTFFKYKCSNKKASEFQENSGILLADEALEMFDDHVKKSALLKVQLPTINRVIKDYQRYENYRKNILARNYHSTEYIWNEKVNGEVLTKEVCMKILTQFKVPTTPTIEEQKFKRCDSAFEDYAVINFDDGIRLYEELILAIASAKPDNWIYKNSGKKDFNPRDYNVWGVLSTYLMFYAVNYDQFDYSDEERQLVNNYFKNKALIERLDRDGNGRPLLCPINNPMQLSKDNHRVNNCGSVRLRFAPAELALAIVMQDEELWAKGLWDLDYTLSMIEDKGFFVPLSAKGCKALGYTWSASQLFSINVEILKLADFDLLDYKTRHGKTVTEAYEMLFKQYEDITISNHIAQKAVGAWSCGEKPYKTHEEYLILQFDPISNPSQTPDPAKLAKAFEYGQVPIYEDFLNWSIRFVSEKHPEWLSHIPSLDKVQVHEWLGAYFKVQAFEIFNANIFTEKNSIWQQKRKQIELEAKQETIDCKVSDLSGEYIISWYVAIPENNWESEYKGKDRLTLDNCKGEIISSEQFWPTSSDGEILKKSSGREKLKVVWKTNGQINISGVLVYWPSGESSYTLLEGSLNNGKISGKNTFHDKINIEITEQVSTATN